MCEPLQHNTDRPAFSTAYLTQFDGVLIVDEHALAKAHPRLHAQIEAVRAAKRAVQRAAA